MLAQEAPDFLRIESQTPARDLGKWAAAEGDAGMAGSPSSQQQRQADGPRLMLRIERQVNVEVVRAHLCRIAKRASEAAGTKLHGV